MIRESNTPIYWVIILLLVAFLLKIVAWPQAVAMVMPPWVLLATLLCIMLVPEWCGVGFAFIVGLITDCINGPLLGQHAFIFVLLGYLAVKANKPLRYLPLWQQSMLIGCVVLVSLLLQQGALFLVGAASLGGKYWLSAISSAIIWPFLMIFFHRFQGQRVII